MDPYLEGHRFGGIHLGLIGTIYRYLNSVLPPPLVASMGERVILVGPGRNIYPDVYIAESRPNYSAGGASVADPPQVVTFMDDEVRQPFIQIVTVGDEENVVAVIEVVNPSNKESGDARDLYLKKQHETLRSATHLIEIDLLRTGQPTVAIPPATLLRAGPPDYVACLHRAGTGRRFEYWPMSIRERLARISVPLTEGVPDVVLDLQSAFETAYDDGAYTRKLDYSKPPEIALSEEDSNWAKSLTGASHR